MLGEGEHREGLLLGAAEEQQLDVGGVVGVDGEVYTAGDGGGSVDLVEAGPDVEAGNPVQRNQVDGSGQGQLDRSPLRHSLDGLGRGLFHKICPLFF